MTDDPQTQPPIRELNKRQRRVLGTLIEKGLTTPDAYPMTLKGLTTGCNQKSNRDPVSSFSEEQVFDTLEELRALGLVAELHTEGGRTSRFRHYMRHRFTFSESQLAILTELMLRGRQQLGELRGRASRMVPIDSLEKLREEVQGLLELDLVQTTGPLERRGVEIDHNLYPEREGQKLAQMADETEEDGPVRPMLGTAGTAAPRPIATTSRTTATAPAESPPEGASHFAQRLEALETRLSRLADENRALREELAGIQDELRSMSDRMDDLRRDLGG